MTHAEPGASTEGAEQPGAPRDHTHAMTAATVTLAVLAVIAAVHLMRDLLVPIAFALVLAVLLSPIVGWLRQLRVPAPAAATITLLATIGTLVAVGAALNSPLRDLTRELPQSIAKARTKITELASPLMRMQRQLNDPAAPPPTSGAAAGGSAQPAAPPVPESKSGGKTGGPPPASLLGGALGGSASILAEIAGVLLLSLLILAGGDVWREKMQDTAPSRRALRSTLQAAQKMRAVVARYLFVTMLINIGQGVLVGLATWWLGLPSPALWGALTFIAEFIPYLGGLVMVGLLAVIGLATLDGGRALLAPGSYLAITFLQNNLVSPIAYGRGLKLNSAMILVGVMFWWMLWGVAGVFLAVPLLACMRILAEHVKALEPVGVFLGDQGEES